MLQSATKHPVYLKLMNEYEELRNSIALSIFEIYNLEINKVPDMEAVYMESVGQYLLVIEKLQAETTCLRTVNKLIRENLQNNIETDLSAVKKISENKNIHLAEKVAILQKKQEAAIDKLFEDSLDNVEYQHINDYFYKLILNTHPELNHPEKQYINFWKKALDYYSEHDLISMLNLLEQVSEMKKYDGYEKAIPVNELEFLISSLRKKQITYQNKLNEIITTFPLCIREKLLDAEWIEEERMRLENKKRELIEDKLVLETQYNTLLKQCDIIIS